MSKKEILLKNQKEYEQFCNEMICDEYIKSEHIQSKGKLTILGILIGIILCLIIAIPYRMIHGASPNTVLSYPIFCLGLIVSIVIHELLHGLGWSINCKHGFKSIEFSLNGMMPLCHCKEALLCSQYLLGVIMPFLILVLGLTIIAYIFSSILLFLITFANIFLASGDLLIAFSLRKSPKSKIIDHPSKPGYVAFTK